MMPALDSIDVAKSFTFIAKVDSQSARGGFPNAFFNRMLFLQIKASRAETVAVGKHFNSVVSGGECRIDRPIYLHGKILVGIFSRSHGR